MYSVYPACHLANCQLVNKYLELYNYADKKLNNTKSFGKEHCIVGKLKEGAPYLTWHVSIVLEERTILAGAFYSAPRNKEN